jgi:Flp pilus assembly protein TadG
LTALLSRFRRNRRGNVAINFAIALLPILAAIGGATDFTEAGRIKAKMQAAADAAAVASVSKNSAAWQAAVNMTSNGSVAAGVTEANSIFNGNIFNFANLYTNPSVTSTVTKTGVNLTSNVQFSAQVPTTFLSVLGVLTHSNSWHTLTVGGSSSATSSLPKYIDFYLMLDVSGSMGLPSTTAEAQRMQAINPDNFVQYPTGCTLACHFAPQNSACKDPPVTPPAQPPANPPTTTTSYTQHYNTNNYCMGYNYSRVSQSALSALLNRASTMQVPKQVPGFPVSMISGLPNSLNTDPTYGLPAVSSCPTAGTDSCIQLRLDAVGYAVSQLLIFATNPAYELIANEFRVGLYPYITSLYSTYTNGLQSNLTGSTLTNAANNLATLLDTNTNSNLGSGGTNQDAALNAMNGLITSVGDGSATPNNTLPYVFIITDGAVTPQTKGVPNGGWSGSNHDTVIANPDTNCTAMKNKGIKIAILYIPFQPINPVNTSFAGDEDDAANNNIPNIPASLKACASPNFFYTANSPQDITNLLQLMFQQALTEAHVTN